MDFCFWRTSFRSSSWSVGFERCSFSRACVLWLGRRDDQRFLWIALMNLELGRNSSCCLFLVCYIEVLASVAHREELRTHLVIRFELSCLRSGTFHFEQFRWNCCLYVSGRRMHLLHSEFLLSSLFPAFSRSHRPAQRCFGSSLLYSADSLLALTTAEPHQCSWCSPVTECHWWIITVRNCYSFSALVPKSCPCRCCSNIGWRSLHNLLVSEFHLFCRCFDGLWIWSRSLSSIDTCRQISFWSTYQGSCMALSYGPTCCTGPSRTFWRSTADFCWIRYFGRRLAKEHRLSRQFWTAWWRHLGQWSMRSRRGRFAIFLLKFGSAASTAWSSATVSILHL